MKLTSQPRFALMATAIAMLALSSCSSSSESATAPAVVVTTTPAAQTTSAVSPPALAPTVPPTLVVTARVDATPDVVDSPSSTTADVAPVAATPRSDLCATMSELAETWTDIGLSVKQRPIRARRMRAASTTVRVLWIGGIHGDEPEGRIATEQLPESLDPDVRRRVDLLQIEDANPDGRAANNRLNANGVDLNRNFPTSNFDPSNKRYGTTPLSQPEARLVHDVIAGFGPDLVIVMHSWSNRTFINFDGPAKTYADLWSTSSGMEIVGSDDLGKKTPGSLGTWAGIEQGIPILTVEFLNGMTPEAAWEKGRPAALAVLEAATPLNRRTPEQCP